METLERLTTARKILMQAEAAVGLERAYPHTYGAHALQIPQSDGSSEELLPVREESLPGERSADAASQSSLNERHISAWGGNAYEWPALAGQEGSVPGKDILENGGGGGRSPAVQDFDIEPTAWSTQMGWAVPASLTGVLPHGLRRGMTVGVRGSRIASLLLAGLASSQGAWVACIGMPDMSWGMALLLGMDFDRVILVPEYKDRVLPQAISTAIDGFDVVVVGQRVFLDSRERRLLSRRALSRKVLLIAEGWESREQVRGQLVGVEGPRGGSGHIGALDLDMSRPGGRPCRLAITQRGWQAREVVRSVPRLDTGVSEAGVSEAYGSEAYGSEAGGSETGGVRLGSEQGASSHRDVLRNEKAERSGENPGGSGGKAMAEQRALKVVLP